VLDGVKVLEFVGIGPGPFASMMLSDLGANVVSIRRPNAGLTVSALSRGRLALEVDLKSPETVADVKRLIAEADVVIEGFRPGVMERLGVGPDDCAALNSRLIYARMTGWGQHGPRADRVGHDLNYISVAGAAHLAARQGERPVPSANLVGDFAGGSMFLVTAILGALIERDRTATGRTLDVAIVDGVNYLTSMQWDLRAQGRWNDQAGTNLLDTGYPYYDFYTCADGKYLSVAPLEPAFFAEMVQLFGLDESWNSRRDDRTQWPALREAIAAAVATRTRDEWAELSRNTDACVAPVLNLPEAYAELSEREVFFSSEQTGQAGPMPRLPFGAETTIAVNAPPLESVDAALAAWAVTN